MVSVLDSELNGPGLNPGWGILLCSWARPFIPVNLLLGSPCNVPASHPGEVELLLVASYYGNRDTLPLYGPLGSYADLTYLQLHTTERLR